MRFNLFCVAVLGCTLHSPVWAQMSPAEKTPPELTPLRYVEDYAYLADPAKRMGEWWEPFKYVPLGSPDAYLTTGADLRVKYEGYDNNLWGSAPEPDDAYVWARALTYADLHVGRHLRGFVQLGAIFSAGVEPEPTPRDESGFDLVQGFAEVRGQVGQAEVALRGGRRLVSYGSERLIGLRYGPNTPRPFDGGVVTSRWGDWKTDLFYLRPVDTDLDDFDDRTSETESLWSLYATRDLPAFGPKGGLDLYYIGFRDEEGSFAQGSAVEDRHTFGARWFGALNGWEWNWEAFHQTGAFGSGDISAWSIGTETRYTFSDLPLTPFVGVRVDVISGDADPADPDLQAFNPLYPRGQYFGEIGLLGPYNLIDFHPAIGVKPNDQWAITASVDLFWRQSEGDGIYDSAGILLRGPGDGEAGFIGTQAEIVIVYAPVRWFETKLALSLFEPGAFIKETGPADTVGFVGLEATIKF